MAQDFQIGRAGLATASGGDGLELKCSSWSQNGDTCKASGVIRGQSSVAAVNALRQQLSGYDLNTDESVVPVTWVNDPSVDGFYRVQSVEVSEEVTGRMKASPSAGALAFRWDVELLKVPGWQAPHHELIVSGNVRANTYSIVIGDTIPVVGASVGAYGYALDPFPSSVSSATYITGAEGDIPVITCTTPTSYAIAPSWMSTPANFYKGACRLEVSHDSGSTWVTVTGRQVKNLPTYWRLSNSVVRVTSTATAAKTELSVEHHDGTAWEPAKVYQLTGDTSYTPYAVAPVALTVNHLRPDSVSVRVELGDLGLAFAVQNYIDVTIRRGSRNVECYWKASTSAVNIGVRRATNEASAALSTACGIRANATDASGNKYVIATPLALAGSDNTIGAIRVSSSYLPFCISSAIGGTVGTGYDATMGLALSYMAAVRHRQRIVAR